MRPKLLLEEITEKFESLGYQVDWGGASMIVDIWDEVIVKNVKTVKAAYGLVFSVFGVSSLSYRYVGEGRRGIWLTKSPPWLLFIEYDRLNRSLMIGLDSGWSAIQEGDYFIQKEGDIKVHVDDIPRFALTREQRIRLMYEKGIDFARRSLSSLQANKHIYKIEVDSENRSDLLITDNRHETVPKTFWFSEAIAEEVEAFKSHLRDRFRFEEAMSEFHRGLAEGLESVVREYGEAWLIYDARYSSIMEKVEKERLNAISEVPKELDNFPCGFAYIEFIDEPFRKVWMTLNDITTPSEDSETSKFRSSLSVHTPYQGVYANEWVAERMANILRRSGIECSVWSRWD